MMPLIILAAIAGAPVLLALLFRVNSAMVFLSIAAGSLLQRAFGDSAALALGMVLRNAPTTTVADLGLLALPVLLTVIFLRKTTRGTGLILQLVPLIAAAAALVALTLPVLPTAVQNQIYQSHIGGIVRQSQDVAVGVAAVLNLLVAWRVYRHRDEQPHHRR